MEYYINFPKFLLLVEMDGMKEGNEENGYAPFPVPPMESSFHSAVSKMAPALHHGEQGLKEVAWPEVTGHLLFLGSGEQRLQILEPQRFSHREPGNMSTENPVPV